MNKQIFKKQTRYDKKQMKKSEQRQENNQHLSLGQKPSDGKQSRTTVNCNNNMEKNLGLFYTK